MGTEPSKAIWSNNMASSPSYALQSSPYLMLHFRENYVHNIFLSSCTGKIMKVDTKGWTHAVGLAF